MNESHRLVRLPNLEITIDRAENGDFILKSGIRGETRMERKEMMLKVLGEWIEHQDRFLREWKAQNQAPEFMKTLKF